MLALVPAGLGCGPDPSPGADGTRPASAVETDQAPAPSGGAPDALRGTWEGAWIEEWRSDDLPPDLRLPDRIRSPGTLTIETVGDDHASGTWTALEPGPGREGLARGRFVAEVHETGWTVRGGRFTNRGSEVIATVDLGPRCRLVEDEAFHGGLGPGAEGSLLLSARRRFRCRDGDAGSAWTVEARWTFYGRRAGGRPARERSRGS